MFYSDTKQTVFVYVCVCVWLQAGGGAASVSKVSGQRGATGAGTTAGRQTDGSYTSNKIQGIDINHGLGLHMYISEDITCKVHIHACTPKYIHTNILCMYKVLAMQYKQDGCKLSNQTKYIYSKYIIQGNIKNHFFFLLFFFPYFLVLCVYWRVIHYLKRCIPPQTESELRLISYNIKTTYCCREKHWSSH